jgi:bifunctional N-acetylglucosamine-1-phosphate-uridyltransferase/glucosamine-1-phosphate-acetyltransferase GlmU-like protein
MLGFLTDLRTRTWIIFGIYVILFIAGLSIFFSKSSGLIISGIKKSNGRLEITYQSSSADPVTVAPVTGIFLVPENPEDSTSVNKIVLRTSLYGNFTIDDTVYELEEDEKESLHEELISFADDGSVTEYGRTFGRSWFVRLLGIILAAVSAWFGYKSYKDIPDATEEQKAEIVSKLKNIGSGIAHLKDKLPKNIVPKKIIPKKTDSKDGSRTQVIDTTEKLLKVVIFTSDGKGIDPEAFKIPGMESIKIACESSMKNDIEAKYGREFGYISNDGKNSLPEILLGLESSMKNFTGYLIVQTKPQPDINNNYADKFYKFHKERNNEATIATGESSEEKIPSGKIIRNMANRIMRISASEELNDNPGMPCEIYAGLMCFNTKKFFDSLRKYVSGSNYNGSLEGLIELYSRNGYKVNNLPLSDGNTASIASKNFMASKPFASHSQKSSALIISSGQDPLKSILKSYEAVSIPEIENTGIIIKKEFEENIKETLGDSPQIMLTEDDLGDGYDAMKAYDWLRNSGGNVVAVSGECVKISKDVIKNLIIMHTGNNNTCTTVLNGEYPIIYCVKTDYFIYAVKRIIKDDDTKKYYLSQITQILQDDKKQVSVIPVDDLLN